MVYLILVDEHIDIYQDYSDNVYDKFINESKKIFDKYKFHCNINIWNKSKCQSFYCDLGFYFDTYQNKCIKDICIFEEEELIPFWAISIIVGAGILVLFIALFLIRRTVNIGKKPIYEFKANNEDKLME